MKTKRKTALKKKISGGHILDKIQSSKVVYLKKCDNLLLYLKEKYNVNDEDFKKILINKRK